MDHYKLQTYTNDKANDKPKKQLAKEKAKHKPKKQIAKDKPKKQIVK